MSRHRKSAQRRSLEIIVWSFGVAIGLVIFASVFAPTLLQH